MRAQGAGAADVVGCVSVRAGEGWVLEGAPGECIALGVLWLLHGLRLTRRTVDRDLLTPRGATGAIDGSPVALCPCRALLPRCSAPVSPLMVGWTTGWIAFSSNA